MRPRRSRLHKVSVLFLHYSSWASRRWVLAARHGTEVLHLSRSAAHWHWTVWRADVLWYRAPASPEQCSGEPPRVGVGGGGGPTPGRRRDGTIAAALPWSVPCRALCSGLRRFPGAASPRSSPRSTVAPADHRQVGYYGRLRQWQTLNMRPGRGPGLQTPRHAPLVHGSLSDIRISTH